MTEERGKMKEEQRPEESLSGGSVQVSESGPDSSRVLLDLKAGLDKLDMIYGSEASPPPADVLARRLAAASGQSRLKQKREWMLFGTVSLIVVSCSLAGAMSAPVLYWGVQGLLLAAGFIGSVVKAGGWRKWK